MRLFKFINTSLLLLNGGWLLGRLSSITNNGLQRLYVHWKRICKIFRNADNIASTAGTILMTLPNLAPILNGILKFGPDGYLYIWTGHWKWRSRKVDTKTLLPILVNVAIDVNSTVFLLLHLQIVWDCRKWWNLVIDSPWKFSFNRLNGDLWIVT
jgi:hypothetical protein